MNEIKKYYKATFNTPEYDTVYTFHLHESGAFAYGNRTAVSIYRGDYFIGAVDTRYDKEVLKDFGKWCRGWLKENHDPNYGPKFREIKKKASA